jgi:5'-nucleotidase (lipoprotein e(P4) family)
MQRPHTFVCSLLCVVLAFAALASAGDAPPVQGSLDANVYTHASAEYRACCLTIYAAAGYRLEELVGGAYPPYERPAVVMDLDETVLDITSFQTFLYENGLDYTTALWSAYEQVGVEEVRLVPGVREFIDKAEALGVSVVYLSNRNEANRVYTIAALERLGLSVNGIDERIYLKPTGGSSDKSPRRDAIAARYNVLMIFGDNLRDFSEVFKPERPAGDVTPADYTAAIDARDRAVDDAQCHWGVDWFVLPNCMYGEWEKLVSPNPVDVMRPTSMEVPSDEE